MCTEVTHEYSVCKHQVIQKVPCATSHRAPCGVISPRTVVHQTKCYQCGGAGGKR
jgi:hypothetical protein